jgi:hypothetical protein
MEFIFKQIKQFKTDYQIIIDEMAVAMQEAKSIKVLLEKNMTPKNDASSLFESDNQLDHSEDEMLVIQEDIEDIDNNSMNQSMSEDRQSDRELDEILKNLRLDKCAEKASEYAKYDLVHCMSDHSKIYLSHLKKPNKLGEFNWQKIVY